MGCPSDSEVFLGMFHVLGVPGLLTGFQGTQLREPNVLRSLKSYCQAGSVACFTFLHEPGWVSEPQYVPLGHK